MNERLNIPLQPVATRRVDRRVIWMWINCSLVAATAIIAWRFWLVRDLTSSWRPDGATQTVRLIKTPANAKILHENLGQAAAIAGGPWSIDDLMLMTDREISIHLMDSAVVGITIDRELDHEFLATSEEYGLVAQARNHRTYIGQLPPADRAKFRLSLLAFSDGEIFDFGEKIGSLQISEDGLLMRGFGLNAGPRPTGLDSEIVANVSVPANSSLWPKILEPLQAQEIFSNLQEKIEQSGIGITIGQDEQGTTLAIFAPTAEISIDELAKIGKDILNRQNLTTLELTNPDGSSILELYSNSVQIKSEISTEEGQTIIKLTSSNSSGLKIVKNIEGIYIFNRPDQQIIDDKIAKSACYKSATSFIKDTAINSVPEYLDGYFKEIAWNSSALKLCW